MKTKCVCIILINLYVKLQDNSLVHLNESRQYKTRRCRRGEGMGG